MSERELELELYSPHEMQRKFHSSKARFRVAAWGRQSGKSTACLNDLFHRGWVNKGQNIWFISPTYDQARVQFRRALKMFPENSGIYRQKPHAGEFWLPLRSGSDIKFKSGWNADNLRGDTLHGVVIDEVRDQPKDLWRLVIRPMLATTLGWGAFVSTPRGYDQFYDLYTEALACKDGTWESFQSPSTCNPLFTKEEFEQAKQDMSEPEFAQEILAEFRNLTQGNAYHNLGDYNLSEQNRFASPSDTVNPFLPVDLQCDFNVRPIGWVMAQRKQGYGSHYFDEIFLLSRSHTEEAAKEFVSRFKKLNIRTNPQVRVVGDATGRAAKSSAGGNTDYSILFQVLKDNGITFEDCVPQVNPLVKDRVNTVNARLRSASGETQITLNPKTCLNVYKDLQTVLWKQGATAILDQTTDPTKTHLSDALGYGECVFNPLKPIDDVGSLRMIRR